MDDTNINSNTPQRRGRTGLYARGESALKLRSRKVRKLVDKARVVCPWIEGSDLPCVRSWAELEILGVSVFRELVQNGVLTPDREARRLLNDYQKLKKTQLAYETALGMTPASRIALTAGSADAALDLVAQMAQQAEEVEQAGEPEADKSH
jgi:hypothetical protein